MKYIEYIKPKIDRIYDRIFPFAIITISQEIIYVGHHARDLIQITETMNAYDNEAKLERVTARKYNKLLEKIQY